MRCREVRVKPYGFLEGRTRLVVLPALPGVFALHEQALGARNRSLVGRLISGGGKARDHEARKRQERYGHCSAKPEYSVQEADRRDQERADMYFLWHRPAVAEFTSSKSPDSHRVDSRLRLPNMQLVSRVGHTPFAAADRWRVVGCAWFRWREQRSCQLTCALG